MEKGWDWDPGVRWLGAKKGLVEQEPGSTCTGTRHRRKKNQRALKMVELAKLRHRASSIQVVCRQVEVAVTGAVIAHPGGQGGRVQESTCWLVALLNRDRHCMRCSSMQLHSTI